MSSRDHGIRQVGFAAVALGYDGHVQAFCLYCPWTGTSLSSVDVARWVAEHTREHREPRYPYQTAEYAEGAGPPVVPVAGGEAG